MRARKERICRRLWIAGMMTALIAVILVSGCKVIGIDEKKAGADTGAVLEKESAAQKMASTASKINNAIVSNVVRDIAPSTECRGVSLVISSVENKEQLCMYRNTLNMVLLNDGDIRMIGLDLYLKGKNSDETLTRIQNPIEIGGLSRQIALYDAQKYGEIDKVRIIPLIKLDNGRIAACDVKEIEEADIPECS